jgi:hypothetical protein
MRPERGRDMKPRSYWLATALSTGVVAAATALLPAAAKPLLSGQHIASFEGNNNCLGAAGGPVEPDIVVFPCLPHPDQIWTMTNKGELVNQNHQCIGVESGKVARGANLVGFRCDGTSNQRWTFNPDRGGTGIFANGANSDLCMTRVVTPQRLNHVVLNTCVKQWSAQYWVAPAD